MRWSECVRSGRGKSSVAEKKFDYSFLLITAKLYSILAPLLRKQSPLAEHARQLQRLRAAELLRGHHPLPGPSGAQGPPKGLPVDGAVLSQSTAEGETQSGGGGGDGSCRKSRRRISRPGGPRGAAAAAAGLIPAAKGCQILRLLQPRRPAATGDGALLRQRRRQYHEFARRRRRRRPRQEPEEEEKEE